MFLFIFFIAIIGVLYNKNNALLFWMLSSLLIPSYVRILPVPLSFGLGLTFFLFVLSFLYPIDIPKSLKRGFRWTFIFSIHYILIRLLFSFLGTFFSWFDILKKSYINCLFLAVIVFIVWKISNKQSLNKAYKSICVVLFIVCLYGIFTYVIGNNPYMNFLSKYSEMKFDLSEVSSIYASEVRGGLKSRISVLTYNPLQYAILINAFIFVPIYLYLKERKIIYLGVIGIMFINLFLTGSRGPLISLIISCSLFYLMYQNIKGKIIFIVGVVFAVSLLFIIPGLDVYASYIKSILFIFSEKASEAAEIKGSSISGRMVQLEGVLSIVASSKSEWSTIMFGFGDGYTTYFLETYGTDYDGVGAFEGVLLSSLLNYGICGLLLVDMLPWLFVFYCIKSAKKAKYISRRDSYLLYSMLLTQIIFSFLVGSVYYLIYYSILFSIMKNMMIEHFEKLKLKYVGLLLKKNK